MEEFKLLIIQKLVGIVMILLVIATAAWGTATSPLVKGTHREAAFAVSFIAAVPAVAITAITAIVLLCELCF